MNMIENHMEQIALSSTAIAELPFPPPKIFTNALLHPHDITALIRDTEAHERALFRVAPPEPGSYEPVARKSSIFATGDGLKGGAYPGLKPTTAVGRILGGDFMDKVRRQERGGEWKEKGDVDVEFLLRGAEKLHRVYPVPGVMDKIKSFRTRYEQLSASVASYESRVAKQAAQLARMNYPRDEADPPEEEESYEDGAEPYEVPEGDSFTAEDFKREEAAMRELEEKRRGLEDRVSGMEKDLGGLMR